jgi:hypothetical protein
VISRNEFLGLVTDVRRLTSIEPIAGRALWNIVCHDTDVPTRRRFALSGVHPEYLRGAARAAVRFRLHLAREFQVPSTTVLVRDARLDMYFKRDLRAAQRVPLVCEPAWIRPSHRGEASRAIFRAELDAIQARMAATAALQRAGLWEIEDGPVTDLEEDSDEQDDEWKLPELWHYNGDDWPLEAPTCELDLEDGLSTEQPPCARLLSPQESRALGRTVFHRLRAACQRGWSELWSAGVLHNPRVEYWAE